MPTKSNPRPALEGTFQSSAGSRLHFRIWPHENPGAPLFVILHGFGEYSGRYQAFVDRLASHPVTFASFDHRGHGQSEGERVYVDRFESYVEDVDRFLAELAKDHGLSVSDIILFGHSMGGEIAVYYALENPGRVKTLILSSPCIEPECWFPYAEKAVAALAKRFPKFIIENPVPPVFLTHDKEQVKTYKTDPLIQRRISVKLLAEMIRVSSVIHSRAGELKTPLYILAAGCDRIVRKKAAKKFFDKVSSREKEWIEFPGFYHEIFNEKEKEKSYAALMTCLEAALARKAD